MSAPRVGRIYARAAALPISSAENIISHTANNCNAIRQTSFDKRRTSYGERRQAVQRICSLNAQLWSLRSARPCRAITTHCPGYRHAPFRAPAEPAPAPTAPPAPAPTPARVAAEVLKLQTFSFYQSNSNFVVSLPNVRERT